jgi:class 3 adenylate cyclase
MPSALAVYRGLSQCVAETITRLDGFVAKYMCDGVLIYFGYPQAHEDDAERAVRAWLALIEAVGTLRIQEPLREGPSIKASPLPFEARPRLA